MSGQSVAAYMDKASSSRNVGLPTHGILGLPVEIQDAIIAHASVRARFRLQRVSQHFHDRASRVIWRKLQFQLTPAVFPNLKFPGMRMIEALRAVSTSQHNYAQYIHIFDVEVVPDDGIQGANNELLVAHRFLPESDAYVYPLTLISHEHTSGCQSRAFSSGADAKCRSMLFETMLLTLIGKNYCHFHYFSSSIKPSISRFSDGKHPWSWILPVGSYLLVSQVCAFYLFTSMLAPLYTLAGRAPTCH